ncbi:MAG: hypothetical protein FWG50_13385 [Kiritimatiellaeota bacterium]|nr:hypothetical protein [Kiritimatiellota bacterium]
MNGALGGKIDMQDGAGDTSVKWSSVVNPITFEPSRGVRLGSPARSPSLLLSDRFIGFDDAGGMLSASRVLAWDAPQSDADAVNKGHLDGALAPLATRDYVDGAVATFAAGSSDYRWRFIEGLSASTVSSTSRMGYWPYASINSAATWYSWLLAPTVVYPRMDFKTWDGAGVNESYYIIRLQVFWDRITKSTGVRLGQDTTIYLTPNGLTSTLPTTSAGCFPGKGATTTIEDVDIGAQLLLAVGVAPSLYEADIGTITWSSRLLSGALTVNPRIQFRRHAE